MYWFWQMNKARQNQLYSHAFGGVVCAALLMFLLAGTAAAQLVRNSDNKADQLLKSNARVNPSTLAMELSIPFGGFEGRSGHSLPVVFNYSSKVWQIHFLYSWQSLLSVKSDTKPLYALRSAAGWTSSLRVPRIDFNVDMYSGYHEGSQYDGEAWSNTVDTENDPNPPNYPLFYVKRLRVTMPDGSPHEFRKSDGIQSYGTVNSPGDPGLPDHVGTFLSVDGTRMRLELSGTERTLYLPDGSRYVFGQSDTASAYIDKDGNRMSYDAANFRWTDALGRTINDPMPSNWAPFEENQIAGDKTASFPSLAGGVMNATFSWRKLKDPNGGESGLEDISHQLHNLSGVGCQGSATRQLSGPYLFGNPEPSIARVCHPIEWSGLENWWPEPPFNPIVLTKITLASGQKYEFRYNVFGEITKIIYPSGGYERFLYGQVPVVQALGSPTYDQNARG
ncbi:MAG: hypothetical protein WBD22_09030, partial [Pyrinomonadaceae bacterium]